MEFKNTQQLQPATEKLVAPIWHTVVLIGIFAALTIGGAVIQRGSRLAPNGSQHPRMAPVYLSAILSELALVYFVWKAGLRRTGTTLRDLIGGRWSNWKECATDIAFAFGLLFLWIGVDASSKFWLSADHAKSISGLLPRGINEQLLWMAVSVTAGFCEEIVFRGYFQKQFRALTGSAVVAVLLQAILFGFSHGYQGVQAAFKITIFGVLFGVLAHYRKSLRPGMIAHALTDICAGILFPLLAR